MAFSIVSEVEKKMYLVGKNGVLERMVENIQEAMIYRGKKRIPLLEMIPGRMPTKEFKHVNLNALHFTEEDSFLKEITEWYQSIGVYGPYGDVVQLNCRFVKCDPEVDSHVVYTVDFVSHRAYHKPGLASDLVLFIRDLAGSIFFVGIIRGGNPGKGLPALVGGFQDVEQFHLQTPAQTLLHESIQEIGIKILPGENEGKRFREEPFAEKLAVKVQLGKGKKKIITHSELILVRTVNTSKQEWVPSLKLSRVNRTTAYAMVVDLDCHLSLSDVRALFVAGDDAREMFITEIITAKRRIRFGITHHRRLYNEANEALRKFGWEALIK